MGCLCIDHPPHLGLWHWRCGEVALPGQKDLSPRKPEAKPPSAPSLAGPRGGSKDSSVKAPAGRRRPTQAPAARRVPSEEPARGEGEPGGREVMQAAGKVCERIFWLAALPPPPTHPSAPAGPPPPSPPPFLLKCVAPFTSCVMSLGKSPNLRGPQFPLGSTRGDNALEPGGGIRNLLFPWPRAAVDTSPRHPRGRPPPNSSLSSLTSNNLSQS